MITVEVDIHCDYCGAGMFYTYGVIGTTKAQARALAKADGWVLGKRDLCPECEGVA